MPLAWQLGCQDLGEKCVWQVLSHEQRSKQWLLSLLNDEQKVATGGGLSTAQLLWHMVGLKFGRSNCLADLKIGWRGLCNFDGSWIGKVTARIITLDNIGSKEGIPKNFHL